MLRRNLGSNEVAHRNITNEIHLVKIASFVLKSNVPLTLGKLSSCSAPSDDSLPSSEQQGHTQTSFHSEEMFNGMWELLIEVMGVAYTCSYSFSLYIFPTKWLVYVMNLSFGLVSDS